MPSEATTEATWTPYFRDILKSATAPLSLTEIRRRLGNAFPGKAALESELRRGIDLGSYFEWPGTKFWHSDPEAHVQAVLAEVEAQGPQPLRLILKQHKVRFLKLPLARISLIVDRMQSTGTLHVYRDGKDQLLSVQPLPEPAAVMCEIASQRPLSKADLVEEVCGRLPFLSKAAAAKGLDSLVKTCRLRSKGKGKTAVLFARPSDLQQFLDYVIAQAIEQVRDEWRVLLEPLGVEVATSAPAQIPGTDTPELLLNTLRACEPQRGLPIAVQKLRRHPALQNLGKQAFDQAAVELVSQGRVFPFHHTAAQALPASEREELVDDGTGNYYVGLAWRN